MLLSLDKKEKVKGSVVQLDYVKAAFAGVRLTTESYTQAIMLSRGKGNKVRLSDLISKLHESLLELDKICCEPDFNQKSVFSAISHNRVLQSIELLLEDYHNGNKMIDLLTIKSQLIKDKNDNRNFH